MIEYTIELFLTYLFSCMFFL